jgi:hypothetical protein
METNEIELSYIDRLVEESKATTEAGQQAIRNNLERQAVRYKRDREQALGVIATAGNPIIELSLD